jgi:MoaA/NifB/PqqE/SkfB family radical SAM enzyme
MAHNGGLDSVELYGGEPTLRTDFFSILDAARNHGLKRIKIVTNARALADINAAVKTVESGCYFFEIKVHHYQPGIHDYVTRVSGSLQQTVEGIVNLRRINTLYQKPFSAFISLRISMSRQNYGDIGNVALAFIPYKIDRIILSFDDSELEMSKALPHIQNAINLSILNRVWILTQRIPLCAMIGLEHHVSEIYHAPDGDYKKSKNCEKCIYDEVCPGMSTRYLDNFGFSQLKPVSESRHIEDIRSLRNEQD